MDTVHIRIEAPKVVQELIIAELSSLPVSGFEEEADCLNAFFPNSNFTPAVRNAVLEILDPHVAPDAIQEQRIPAQNWNRIWEESIEPLTVPPFYIRPSWVERKGEEFGLVDLVIDPKMSFGTGHHESTRLALRQLLQFKSRMENVLDVGTGTGILAIAAAKLGARFVCGLDHDEWAITNAVENVSKNGVVESVAIRRGAIEMLSNSDKVQEFDLILANINRRVLLSDLEKYLGHLRFDGAIVLSGLQTADREIMCSAIDALDLTPIQEETEGDWWSAAIKRT